ncbi:YybH family protein [Flaviaesturariibacter terrae]
MKRLLLACMLLAALSGAAQSRDEAAVRAVLDRQVAAWNRGDIPGFMEGYWKSDSLMFIGKSGIQWGWQKTLANYQKGYPDTATMGQLSFELLQLRRLSKEYYFVVGKWHLARSKGDVGGHYDLLFRKVKGRWVIVSDHTS